MRYLPCLHRAVLLLPEEDVLEAAGAEDPLAAAVDGEPELGQQLPELRGGPGEHFVVAEEAQRGGHHLGPHHLVQEQLLLPPLGPAPVLGLAHVAGVVLVERGQGSVERPRHHAGVHLGDQLVGGTIIGSANPAPRLEP